MTPLFDQYLIIDWSAANTPKRGKDSIWLCAARQTSGRLRVNAPVNLATRAAAMRDITMRLKTVLARGERAFVGFDFAFGYPAGAARAIAGAPSWSALWQRFEADIEDNDENRSNRFDYAAHLNREIFKRPIYWGHPHQQTFDGLAATKPTSDAFKKLEYRIVERWQPPAKSVWQLAYTGAVGAQAMLGMARLEILRKTFAGACAIWPFETRWTEALTAPITIAEIYPSMFSPDYSDGAVKDAAQVRAVAKTFATADRRGDFAQWLSKPAALTPAENSKILREEGWIVGAGHPISAG